MLAETDVTDIQELRFYATTEHPCSYLENRQARTLFVEPGIHLSRHDYTRLSNHGFRRSGPHVYRPHCQGCKACISVRVPTGNYRFSKSQKRIISRNRDLRLQITDPALTDTRYRLYERYISARHSDGDMYPPSEEQFHSFLVKTSQDTRFYDFFLGETLIAVSVVDRLVHGLSAIYTFYDPDYSQRSLGRYAILSLIQSVQQQQLDYLYLGYWVKGCRKMEYKIQFYPIELLMDNQWVRLSARI